MLNTRIKEVRAHDVVAHLDAVVSAIPHYAAEHKKERSVRADIYVMNVLYTL